MGTALDMGGTVDGDFQSTPAQRHPKSGGYVDGIWKADAAAKPIPGYIVTLQAVSPRELQSITSGGERVVDARRVYINDGDLTELDNGDKWEFDTVDGVFKVLKLDNRPWRNYCKLIVSRIDD